MSKVSCVELAWMLVANKGELCVSFVDGVLCIAIVVLKNQLSNRTLRIRNETANTVNHLFSLSFVSNDDKAGSVAW